MRRTRWFQGWPAWAEEASGLWSLGGGSAARPAQRRALPSPRTSYLAVAVQSALVSIEQLGQLGLAAVGLTAAGRDNDAGGGAGWRRQQQEL